MSIAISLGLGLRERGSGGVVSLLASDQFTGADGTLLSAHSLDTGQSWSGNTANFTLSGGLLTTTTTGTNVATVDATTQAVTISADLVWQASGNVGVMQYLDANNIIMVYFNGSGKLTIIKKVAGTWANVSIATTAVVAGVSHSVAMEVSGTTVTAYLDGVQQLQATVSDIPTTTVAGLYFTGSTSQTADNFRVVRN